MKLARRLESQLNRLFVISTGIGVIVVFLSTAISTIQTKNKAIGFIASNVKQIALAEINSQNVTQVDGEVHRLYGAWRSTQDIDIRTEVLLDGKLIGQSGQLAPFGLLSYHTQKSYDLPSGQKLVINVDLDLAEQIGFDILLVAVFCLFIAACFVLLRKTLRKTIQDVSRPLEERVDWLTNAAKKLPESLKGVHDFQESSIDELQALDQSLKVFTGQILALEERVSEASFQEGRLKMAEIFAHSLKGTLGLLQLRITNAKGLSEKDQGRLLSAVNDVTSAAHDLLHSRKNVAKTQLSPQAILKSVVDQKMESLQATRKISIAMLAEGTSIATLHASASELRAVFSNIIDNAIEAMDAGYITVSVKTDSSGMTIQISDSGRGISPEVLPRLMRDGETFGKKNGNGLGLYHAKQVIESLGGSIRLESVLGKGTDVVIHLPTSNARQIAIPLSQDQTLVVLDDDRSIHKSVKILAGQFSKSVHLHSVEEFEAWMATHGPGDLGERVYWFDYDLKHTCMTGMELIKKYSLQLESYLVTGMACHDVIQAEAKASQIRLLSKDDLANIRFDLKPAPVAQEMGLEA